ncbi:MAG: ATP-binding protein [Gemmatimonadota bacterium]
MLEKTGGNPFYVTQFLYSLADQGLIAYDDRAGRWEWDLEGITSLEVIESVVDLMVARIGRYGEQGRTLLSLASCMGNHFDLETLSIIASTNPRTAARGLWEPLRDGLIQPLQADYEYYQWTHREHGDAPPPERIEYRFAHDRIQQAAYRRIPEEDIERVHLRIGRLLLEKTDEENRSERILDLVNHLDLGRALMAEDERQSLARLNLEAAYAAKEATAFDGALEYVRVAMDLLPENPWEADYDLAYRLHRERIDGEFLAGQWDEATRFFQITLEKAREKAQIADLYQLRIRILLQSDRVFEATDFAVEGCRALGLEFPEDPDAQSELIARELAVFDDYMKSHTTQDLLDRPLMDDPDTAEMLGVLHETWSAAVMAGNANVVVWSAIKTVTLALELGNSVFTSGGYIGMSHVLSLNKRLEEADAIGRMAMELAQRFGDSFLIPKVNNTYCNFTNHFVHHMRDCLPIYGESYRHALLGGDSWWGAWAAGWLRVARLVCGFPLSETLEIQEKFHDYIVSSEYKPLEYYSFMDRQIILNFMGRTVDPLSFTTDDYEESEYVRYFEDTGFGLGLHLHWIYKAIVHWMHGAHELTPALLDEADKHVDFIRLTMPWIDHYFFSPLCAVQHVGSDDPERDRWARDKVQDHLAQLREWEQTGKENFTHRAALVEAEWLRVTGDDAAAVDAYQRAIAAAKAHGYLHHEAMANELAARHHLERGREQAAVGYLLEAHLLYSRWGAERKAEALEAEFPGVLARRRRDPATITATTDPRSITTSRTIGLDTVDLSTVLKASAAISAELNLARLLERLMAITMENAGAQKGVLLFEDEEGATVEAVASVDREDVEVLQGTPLTRSGDVPLSIVEHVQGTGDAVVLDDAGDSGFAEDPYVIDNAVKSVMCLPVVKGRRRQAVLYLENDRVSGAFPPDHVALLRMICTQAAVAIENARLYDTLEQKVELRTEQLAESNRELARGNEELAKKNDEILRQQTQLVHAEKMAALGQLVAGVAHEVNNPVTFVMSGIPAMKRSLDSLFEMVDRQAHGADFEKVSGRLDRLMTAVTEGAERTAEIVNDLRSFSRLGEADVKEVDLGKALEATLGLLRYQCGDRIEIVCDVEQIPPVRCYASQVNQMLMNVLQNAIQAIPERGTVEVRVRPHGASDVCIGIKDSGVGMDEAVKAKLFEPFFTTRAVGSGRGLGLSITHSVVDRHGGRIEVDSALGQGTEFRIYLPLEMSTP